MLDLANDGAVRYMEYLGEPTEAAIGAAISEQRAQEIALAFMTQYVDAEGRSGLHPRKQRIRTGRSRSKGRRTSSRVRYGLTTRRALSFLLKRSRGKIQITSLLPPL